MSSWISTYPKSQTPTYVTVTLQGGFANRVFQILAAQSIAEKTGRHFVLQSEFIQDNPHQSSKETQSDLFEFFGGDLPLYSGPPLVWTSFHEDPSKWFSYDSRSLARGTNLHLIGYFQHPSYFPRQIPRLSSSDPPDPPEKNLYFLHIRLGDYVGSVHDVGLEGYYTRSLTRILETNPLAQFLLLSDEPEKAMDFLRTLPVHLSITKSEAQSPLAVLKEMMRCVGGVCANSSLSWLGAFQAKGVPGPLCMPSRWMKGRTLPKDWYPPWVSVVD